MKHVDSLVLNSKGDILCKIQQLDRQTQLDGKSFYDICNQQFQKTLMRARLNS